MNYYVGIDFGGTGIKIGIINEEGKIIKKDSFVTDPNRPGHEIVAHIADCAKQVVEASDISMDDVLGVGVGSPGLLNPDTGQLKIVTNVPNLNDVYLAPGIEDHLGKPTFLDNDVNAMSLG